VKVLDAIYQTLLDAGEPLHYAEISRQSIEKGLWTPTGSTPKATINAQLSVDIQRNGERSRFQRVGLGQYGLNVTSREALADRQENQSSIPSPDDIGVLSFTDAAEQVLDRSGKRDPMHYRRITDEAIRHGLLSTQGKTPEATMYSQIYSEIERHIQRGTRPRFVKVGRGLFALSKWTATGLAFQIAEHNRKVNERLLDQVRKMDPYEFESLVSLVLSKIGFETNVTRASGDGGVDVRGTLVVGEVIRTRMAVQVKRWSKNIHSDVVQQIRGSLGAHEQGLVITTGDFSAGAKDEAQRSDATPIALMNGKQFVALMIQHNVGVHRESYDIIELGEDDEGVDE
jgi:restriction system protein